MSVLQEGYRLSLLRAVNSLWRQRGYPPTVRELQEFTFASSTSVVTHNLGRLEAMGMVTRVKAQPRTLKLTPKGRLELGIWSPSDGPVSAEDWLEWSRVAPRETRDERYPETVVIGELGANSSYAPVDGVDPLVARRRAERAG